MSGTHWVALDFHRRLILPMLVWMAGVMVGVGEESPGLSVDAQGRLMLAGKPFSGTGVNYYDVFAREVEDLPTGRQDAGLDVLSRFKIPFIRFSAGGYWPADWSLYMTNRDEHFRRLDRLVKAAEQRKIGLIPSLFWLNSTVPDLVNEPVGQWGVTNSRTHVFMLNYTREVVLRYRQSPAIWAWEFGNEYNLAMDLPNAAEHRPVVVPRLGTPKTRSERDDLSLSMVQTALRTFATEVRRHDPSRLIISGNATPRESAWHQAREKSWTKDSPEQFAEALLAENPAPIDSLSFRAYSQASDLARIPAAMGVSRSAKKPLFVGEYGVAGGDTPATREAFSKILTCLETNQVPLSALWVFDFDAQAAKWSVTESNARKWQLEEISKLNKRLSARTQGR